jgi:hypothetical protein
LRQRRPSHGIKPEKSAKDSNQDNDQQKSDGSPEGVDFSNLRDRSSRSCHGAFLILQAVIFGSGVRR